MNNIIKHDQSITLKEREAKNGHRAAVLWFTGLSGSGKSTLAMALQKELFHRGCQVTVLDGDNVRHALNADLGFTDSDRKENLRRVAEVAKLMAESGLLVLTSFISPFREERRSARKIIEPLPFFEIFVDVDLALAESRDPKGIYAKARAGKISHFTGIDSPYEEPEAPDLVVPNSTQTVSGGVEQLIQLLISNNLIPSKH